MLRIELNIIVKTGGSPDAWSWQKLGILSWGHYTDAGEIRPDVRLVTWALSCWLLQYWNISIFISIRVGISVGSVLPLPSLWASPLGPSWFSPSSNYVVNAWPSRTLQGPTLSVVNTHTRTSSLIFFKPPLAKILYCHIKETLFWNETSNTGIGKESNYMT